MAVDVYDLTDLGLDTPVLDGVKRPPDSDYQIIHELQERINTAKTKPCIESCPDHPLTMEALNAVLTLSWHRLWDARAANKMLSEQTGVLNGMKSDLERGLARMGQVCLVMERVFTVFRWSGKVILILVAGGGSWFTIQLLVTLFTGVDVRGGK